MKLRSLLNLTEQAPQIPSPGAPVAAPVAPPSSGAESNPTTTQAPSSNSTAPTPEDPSEYDWTKDFRAFEDAKNKAESEGKKKLLNTMNEKLLGKTIVANASRGYGQPKTDYTIENVKKVSVEFWYKDYVVIVTDANDKKYFLTPGVNIKIKDDETAGEPEGDVPQEPKAGEKMPGAGKEVPNTRGSQTTPPAPDVLTQGQPTTPEAPLQDQQPPAQQPPAQPQGQPTTPQQSPEDSTTIPSKKKKKLAEWTVQQDLSAFLTDFMSDSVKDERGQVNFVPYLKSASQVLTESAESSKQKFLLEIPVSHMVSPLDIREVKLSAVDSMRRFTRFGSYSKGSVEINKVGRLYILEYVKETGWVK